jgi:hypothetical protein
MVGRRRWVGGVEIGRPWLDTPDRVERVARLVAESTGYGDDLAQGAERC